MTANTYKPGQITALYARLSQEDTLEDDSNSIVNQDAICQGNFHPKDESSLPANWNSDKTLFIAFINCYILSLKSSQTLENAKFIASEFALRLSLVLYPFLSCYEPS